MFDIKTASIPFGKENLSVETGRMAKQAAGSVLVRVGDAVILVTATYSKEVREGQDFFPLTVDYRERTYAAGRIPGGFFKRETKPRDKETLTSRLIDRSVRPLFPEGMLNSVQVNAVVISADQVNDTDIPSIVGASLALGISDIPFAGPISAVRIGLIDGNFVVNPTIPEQKISDLDLVVAGNKSSVMMIEAGANEVPEEKLLEAIALAQKEISQACQAQEQFVAQAGKSKFVFEAPVLPEDLVAAVESAAREKIRSAIRTPEKAQREDAMSVIKKEIIEELAEKFPDQESQMGQVIENIIYEEARSLVLGEKRRADGRQFTDIRPLTMEIGVLPRTHGSALFTRGQTQALATVTLGTPEDKQIMDDLEGEHKERFMLHYNFPGFATGEPKPERSPGRREIGHGALAHRALLPLLPSEEEFPYTIRIVSDILESNGSSSMASVCGGSLALFDAGVRLKSSCSGIAMGLVFDKQTGEVAILSDIIGMEDFLGDMDFKVAGTPNGVTALQLDLKIQGISHEILSRAIAQAKEGRLFILGRMDAIANMPRQQLSGFAPQMVAIQIPQEKIGALIGPGGKNIRKIIEESGAEVNVDDEGKVCLSAVNAESIQKAKEMVESITAEAKVGETYTGKVTRLMEFGAFVEILPGKEGLIHISQLGIDRVEKVEDAVKEGDVVTVKCVEVDSQGRINLSRKAALLGDEDMSNYVRPKPARDSGGFRRGRDRGPRREHAGGPRHRD